MGVMEEMFKRAMAEAIEEDRKKPKPLPEAVVMDLKEAAARYGQPCPFRVGDMVTPTSGRDVKGTGEPHVVIDIMENAPPMFIGESGSNMFGKRFDMRVLYKTTEAIVAHWVESACFEPWAEVSR